MANLEILSPLHVGNGSTLGLIDFVLKDKTLVKIKFDKLLDYCFEKKIDLAEGIDNEKFKIAYRNDKIFSIEKFLRFYNIDYNQFAEYEIPLNIEGRKRETKIEIREFIKNVEKKPYLPGSSIKGGVRTALLWKIMSEEGSKINKYCDELMEKRIDRSKACDNLEKEIFGRDAHEDILRALRISDTKPLEPSNLDVSEIKILGNPSSIPTYVECLKNGKTTFDLWIDEKLLGERLFEGNKLRDYLCIDGILEVCHEFSVAIIEKQSKYNFENNTKIFFNDLKRNIESCKENEAILNIGWGGGWYSKTIGLEVEKYKNFTANPRSDQFKRTLRYKLNLGKKPGSREFVLNFPKTRRVTIDGLLMGWMKIQA